MLFDPNNDELFEEEPAIVGFQRIVLARYRLKTLSFLLHSHPAMKKLFSCLEQLTPPLSLFLNKIFE